MSKVMTYLALGDSYTIGEGVHISLSFPYITTQLLRKRGWNVTAPEIIATTGWTTGELQDAINRTSFLPSYDLVTLLIGVNNQYRGLSTTEYETEFTSLLNQAIQFAAGENRNVYVLSIPDWGVTPFAKDRNAGEIRNAIDEFNCINQTISEKQRVNYIEITEGTRRAGEDPSLLAPDGLHYSGTEHLRWAEQLVGAILRTKEGM